VIRKQVKLNAQVWQDECVRQQRRNIKITGKLVRKVGYAVNRLERYKILPAFQFYEEKIIKSTNVESDT
jgi:hypothetical protein